MIFSEVESAIQRGGGGGYEVGFTYLTEGVCGCELLGYIWVLDMKSMEDGNGCWEQKLTRQKECGRVKSFLQAAEL